MLRSLKPLRRYEVCAADGIVGRASDFLLDDERWTIRYLVVETGGLLSRHHVLITPRAVVEIAWPLERFQLALSKATVEQSPDVDLALPISRQFEESLHDYYGYTQYWDAAEAFTAGASPALLVAATTVQLPHSHSDRSTNECHVRSAKEVSGYDIQATDGSIGHVDDFVIDDEGWKIRYLVADTSNWGLGKKVLIAPEWAIEINWLERYVRLDMSRDTVKESPEWDPERIVDRDYEERLHAHYRLPNYWSNSTIGPLGRSAGE